MGQGHLWPRVTMRFAVSIRPMDIRIGLHVEPARSGFDS